jgi:hypothetical protein
MVLAPMIRALAATTTPKVCAFALLSSLVAMSSVLSNGEAREIVTCRPKPVQIRRSQ